MQSPSLNVLAALAIGLASCSQEQTAYTDTERKCIAQRYAAYDAEQLIQCVDVCKTCLKGNVLTCNTSCKLREGSQFWKSQSDAFKAVFNKARHYRFVTGWTCLDVISDAEPSMSVIIPKRACT